MITICIFYRGQGFSSFYDGGIVSNIFYILTSIFAILKVGNCGAKCGEFGARN